MRVTPATWPWMARWIRVRHAPGNVLLLAVEALSAWIFRGRWWTHSSVSSAGGPGAVDNKWQTRTSGFAVGISGAARIPRTSASSWGCRVGCSTRSVI